MSETNTSIHIPRYPPTMERTMEESNAMVEVRDENSLVEQLDAVEEKFCETEEWKKRVKEVNALHAENDHFRTLGWDYESYSDEPASIPDKQETLAMVERFDEVINKYKNETSVVPNKPDRTWLCPRQNKRILYCDEEIELHSNTDAPFPKPVSLDNVTNVLTGNGPDNERNREQSLIEELEKLSPEGKRLSLNYCPLRDLWMGQRDTCLEEPFTFKKYSRDEMTDPIVEKKHLYWYKGNKLCVIPDNLNDCEPRYLPFESNYQATDITKPVERMNKVKGIQIILKIGNDNTGHVTRGNNESLKDMSKKDRKAARKALQTRNPAHYQKKR